MRTGPEASVPKAESLFGGSGMGALFRAHDWSTSPLGPPENWPQSLGMLVGVMLAAQQPMFLVWGPGRALLYNDRYMEVLGSKHPALGRDFLEIWHEVKADHATLVERAYQGAASLADEITLLVERNGHSQEAHFAVSYTPVRDAEGRVAGVFCVCVETTRQVLAEKRQTFRLTLEERLHSAKTPADAVNIACEVTGEALDGMVCTFSELDASDRSLRVSGQWSACNLPSMIGQHHSEAWGPEQLQNFLSGQSERIEDARTDLRTANTPAEAAYAALGCRAWLSVPLMRDGRVRAALTVGVAKSRRWSDDEVTFVSQMMDRAWQAADRARAETAIAASERELRFAIKAGRLGTWSLDLASGELTTSEICRLNFGRDPNVPFSYADLRDAIYPDDSMRMAEAVERCIVSGADYDIEYRIVTAAGEIRCVAIRGQLVYTGDGTPFEMAGVSIDITDKRRTEDKLIESETRYRTLFDSIDEGFCVIEFIDGPHGPLSDYVHVEANQAYMRHAGIPDIVGKTGRGELTQSEADAWVAIFRNVLETGEPIRFERELKATDRHLEVACSRVEPAARRQVAILFQDVSARKRAEKRLHELNETLESQIAERTAERDRMWDTSPALMLVIDFDGYLRRVNPAWTALLGYTSEELVGRHVNEFVLPADHTSTIHAYKVAALGGRTAIENRYRHKDGSIRWISWVAAPAGDMTYATGRDITAEKEREEELATRTAERERLWNLSQDMLARANYEGKMSAVSPAWTQVLGWSETELLTRPYASFMHPQDMPPTLDAIARMAGTYKPARFENRIATSEGGWKHIEWTVTPELDGENFVAVGRDVSLSKAREAELKHAQDALRQSQKMEAVGQLTGGLAHDFNNMLASISGALQVLNFKIHRGQYSGLERYIDLGESSVRRAASLTHRLLAFSRRQTLDPKPTDVNHLIVGMEELVRRSIGPMVELVVVKAQDLGLTKIDSSQLENAVLNLCLNARDAMMPGGGRLTLVTANYWVDEPTAKAAEMRPGRYISLCVSDTGTGMPPEVITRIFDPFFTTKPLGQGTGLGLSMVYGFAHQSDGQIRVHSEVGVGTTMSLYLPYYAGAMQDEEVVEDLSIESGKGETVLLIEDEHALREIVEEVMRDAGYRVLTAQDGLTGLQILNSDTHVDLLITDVGLPGGLNGRQVADAARVQRPSLKVLFITGYADTAIVGNGRLDAGMEVMTKPFEISAFVNKVRILIEMRLQH